MDLNLLYIFNAIYRERNLSRAAERLGISPSGVSAALRRLRDEFEDSLFVRLPHGVEPTVRAEEIAEKFCLALDLVEQAKRPESEFDPSSETRTFIIGLSDYSQAVIMPKLLKTLDEHAPRITLALRHMGYLPIRQSLEEGMFDLVIGNVYSSLGRLRHQNLLKECFYGIVANDHPLADKAFDLEELSSYPALLTEGQGSDRWWEHPLVRDAGYKPTQVTSIPGFLGVSLLLAGSPLVCISARRLCEVFTKAYPLKAIALPFSKQVVAIKQYWHERSQGDPAHRWLRQAIYNVCQSIEKN